MNSHQRRKRACAQHYRMPLGCTVKVRDGSVWRVGTLAKHDRGGRCIVHFAEHNIRTFCTNPHSQIPFAWISYHDVRPVGTHRVRPWWRVLREERRRV